MSDRYVATLLAAVLMKRIVLVIQLKLKIYKMETITALISLAVLVALICDAKASETHFLNRTRIARKIRKVQEANKATELDTLYYRNQIGK